MGIAYQKLRDFQKASEYFQNALNLVKDCPEDMYLRKAEILNSYAAFLLDQKDIVGANQQMQEALKFASLHLKDDQHPVLAHIFMIQADIIEAEQRATDQVKQLRTQANEIFREFLGADCPFIRE